MKKQKIIFKKWFTLVELIVVITILAILWTIAFISLNWYSRDARDSARITDLSSIVTSLELFNLEAGKYPYPTNFTDVTYSGSVVWKQWTFSDSVNTNVKIIDDIPVDPLTWTKYTYSVTSKRNEFQIWGIAEWDTISMNNLLVSQSLAWDVTATAILKWNYNWVMAKSLTWTHCDILSTPSIIASDLETSSDVLDIINNNRLVYNWFKNLPNTFRFSKFKYNWWFDFLPTRKIVYSDESSCEPLTDKINYLARVELLKWIQEAYSWTILNSKGEIANMLSLNINTTNPSNDVINYAWTYVNNNLWWNIPISLSNSPLTYNNCDFNWNSINHNTSVTAYETNSVTFWNTCNSEQRTCINWSLGWTFTFTWCTVQWATWTFNLSQSSVTQWTNVTISNTCSQAPTSYTSSNLSVATISWNTITTLSAWTTNVTPVWWSCWDNTTKTLTVNPVLYTNIDWSQTPYIPDRTDGSWRFTLVSWSVWSWWNWVILDNITWLYWMSDWLVAWTSNSWTMALSYCANLNLWGYTDWRLPDITELSSLVDLNLYVPSINLTYFIIYVSTYWSSTTYANVTTNANLVNFTYGSTTSNLKTANWRVLCTR